MLVLALADAHIPDRAIDIPDKFKKLLNVPDKISQVLLLGNCTKSHSFNEFISNISPNVAVVRGEFDNATYPVVQKKNNKEQVVNVDIPMSAVIKVGEFKIGCYSGYTIIPKNDPLSMLAVTRQLDVDILLWGGTHNVEAYTLEDKFFVNPGSCTGAFNTDWPVNLNNDDEQTELNNDIPVSTLNGKDASVEKPPTATEPTADAKGSVTDETTEDTLVKEGKDKDTNIMTNSDVKDSENENENSTINGNVTSELSLDLDISEFDIDGSNVPSFCLLDIQGATCTLYIYLHIDGEVKVDKVVYEKVYN
ncbi:hypothetical protein TPHA_0K00160 [Tetrapisispora phaffii CBS 4417]|uniref:Vacuolar protein sorting-associated protein 29 n=1 Tax=Tetrapisispora phaffii (strain ATCC 24235 / CBS 4417 / NBRC 1672 / NRRL Y-8282 / UCD 70-5) TaxID=1071381 RepID=G8BZ22_TETPH|nr:hypothetical protein TPHA_0K00160 [Tetrapisispora phaffii CBS 4417]CCE65150.1 hypothetical protein TPHA_0K00160 [Tetrapisispora phaffii CBS 4417]